VLQVNRAAVRYHLSKDRTVTIGALAAQAGVRPSAIRYYERLGLLTPPIRRSGRRDYDPDAVAQLAVVQFALAAGFTLRDAKHLVRGFSTNTSAALRWRQLAAAKTRELDDLIARATAMKTLLLRLSTNCTCETLIQCGRGLARSRAKWAAENRTRLPRSIPKP
jgi:MerR family transcriptional regulator, redox-sensitive transcriptional activator SoxR